MGPYKRQFEGDFVRSRHDHPNWPTVISEGDSWFSYPFQRNIVDWLDDPRDTGDPAQQTPWALFRLEGSGDEILSILSGGQRASLRQYFSNYRPDVLLFSGGGNDIVGPDLLALLKSYQPGASAADCLRGDRLDRRLRQIKDCYLELIDLCGDNSPATTILAHGYDYVVPSSQGVKLIGLKITGPWMKPYFEQRGIPPAIQAAIVKILIDRFNDEILAPLAGPRFVHVDLRNTVGNDWANEIHPNRNGSKRLASRFKAALAPLLPGVPLSPL